MSRGFAIFIEHGLEPIGDDIPGGRRKEHRILKKMRDWKRGVEWNRQEDGKGGWKGRSAGWWWYGLLKNATRLVAHIGDQDSKGSDAPGNDRWSLHGGDYG